MAASTSTTGSCSGKATLPASAEPPQAAALHAELRRMVQFAQAFPLPEIVATLSRPLSWSHFVNLLPLKTEPARQFYASQAATNTWSVRQLRHPIDRKAFERTELAALQTQTPVQAELVETTHTNPAQVFKDPYFLNFLGLRQGHDEAGLEAAILRQLEAFILELGRGCAFVERQKRMVPASLCAPSPAANKWCCCKCTKTASLWPNTGPNCPPKQRWSKSRMQRCLKCASGWRGAGCCWDTRTTSDDHEGQQRPGVPRGGPARRGTDACTLRRRARSLRGRRRMMRISAISRVLNPLPTSRSALLRDSESSKSRRSFSNPSAAQAPRGRAGVLCGRNAGYAELGDWDGRG